MSEFPLHKILVLPIKRKWFDMIKSSEKREEYREVKPYFDVRIWDNWWVECCRKGLVPVIEFVNGYGKNAPRFRVRCIRCCIRSWSQYPDWGEPKGCHFVMGLDNVGGIK